MESHSFYDTVLNLNTLRITGRTTSISTCCVSNEIAGASVLALRPSHDTFSRRSFHDSRAPPLLQIQNNPARFSATLLCHLNKQSREPTALVLSTSIAFSILGEAPTRKSLSRAIAMRAGDRCQCHTRSSRHLGDRVDSSRELLRPLRVGFTAPSI
ncbi:hypothetical protein BDW22DRAFT_911929 [Trametopsis cervina]|nr:hypothetical protein BDW22DRAFT_911929 [Trametopsis cervina]